MKLTKLAIKNNRVTVIALVIVIVAGLMTFKSISQSEFPAFTIRVATVMTVFPGATPEKIEKLVTDKLEKKIQEMPEIDFIKSESKAGVSIIYVNIKEDYKNMRPIWDTLRRKVNTVKTSLPKGIYGPFINDEFGEVFGTLISIKGKDFSYKELKDISDKVRNNLLNIKDVAKVKIIGEQKEKIFIEYNNEKLAKFNIPPLYIKKLLNQQNIITPGGSIELDNKKIIYLEPSGNFKNIEELKNTIVRLPNQKDVFFLKDLVDIKRGYVNPAKEKVHSSGEDSLILAISMRKGGNIINLGKDVKKTLKILKKDIPYGMDMDIMYFQPDIVSNSVNNFLINLIQSIVIVILILLILLGIKTGILVASMIPITIIMTFLAMYFFKLGINQVSLAALLIALGMLVDNSIVVSESILVQIKNGMSPYKAAVSSTKELYKPLLISSLITSSAFLPIFLADSKVGEYTSAIFKVVTITLLSSWLLSITIIPLLAIKLINPKKNKENKENYNNIIYKTYKKTLIWVLRNKLISLLIIFSLMGVAIYNATFIKKQFFPSSDAKNLTVKINMPALTSLNETEKVVSGIESLIKKELKVNKNRKNGVVSWISYIGESGPRYILSHNPKAPSTDFAFMLLNITDIKEFKHIKKVINNYSLKTYPDANIRVAATPLGVPVNYPVEIRVSGENEKEVQKIVKKIKNKLSKMNEISMITDNWGEKTLRFKIEINPVKAYHANISNFDIAISLQTALSGLKIDEYREGSNIITIDLKSINGKKLNINELRTINVFSTSGGKSIPLNQIANIKPYYGYSKIIRRNRYRTITVQADLKDGVVASVVNQKLRKYLNKLNSKLEYGYSASLAGEAAESDIANKSISEKLPIAGLIIILLLVLQFNSFRKPLILFTIVPLTIIGVVLGLRLTGASFGFMTLLGVISLSGIVINNANVLMDKIRLEIEELKSEPQKAIISASQTRLRPIFLTTLTTVGGLIPLWLGGGPLWESMSVSLIFGLSFATLITLIVVPLMYSILYRIKFN